MQLDVRRSVVDQVPQDHICCNAHKELRGKWIWACDAMKCDRKTSIA